YVTHRESFALSSSIHVLLEGELSQVRTQRRDGKGADAVFNISGKVPVAERFLDVAPHASEVFLFGVNDTELQSQIKVHHVTFAPRDATQRCSFRLTDDALSLAEFARVMDATKHARTFYLVRDLASARYWESRALASPDVVIEFDRVVFQLPYALVEKNIFTKMSEGVTLAHRHASSNPQGVLPIAKCIMMNTMDTGITLTNSRIKSSEKSSDWTDLHNYRKSFKPGGNDDKHSDSDFVFEGGSFTEHKHMRRLLLSAECQIGKTGTYISLFQQLRAEIGEGASSPELREEIVCAPLELPVAILEPDETLTGLPHAVRWVYPSWEDLRSMLMKRSNFPYFKIRVAKYHPRLVRFRLVMLLTVLKRAESDSQAVSHLKARLGDFWCKFVKGYVETLEHGECIVSAGSQECLREWSKDLTATDNDRVKELYYWVKDQVSFDSETGQWVDDAGIPPPSIPKALLPFLLRALDWDGRMKQCFREQGALEQDPLADVNGDPKSWDQVFGAGGRAHSGPDNALVRRDPVLDGCAEEPLSTKLAAEDSEARKNAAAQGYFPCVFTSAPSGGGQEYTLGNADRRDVFEAGLTATSAAVKFWIPEEFEHKEWVQREGGTITGFKEKQRGDQKRFRWIFNPTAFRAETAMLDYSRCFAGEDVGEFAQVLVVREEELEKYKEASAGCTLNPKH
ncbi:hypothetical protein T484DRAFT_1801447, partial [Baffinella frigidus]